MFKLRVCCALSFIEELDAEFVFEIGHASDFVRMRPGIAVVFHAVYIGIIAAIDQLIQFPGVDIERPQPNFVIAIMGVHQQVVGLSVINVFDSKGLEIIFAHAVDFSPARAAGFAPVPDELAMSQIETTGKPWISVGVEVDIGERELAANQQFLIAGIEVEFPVSARPECRRQLGARPIVVTLRERDDDLVGLVRQKINDCRVRFVERAYFLFLDVNDSNLVLVHTLVKALNPVADFLPQGEHDVLVAGPVEIRNFHRVGVNAERLLGQIGRIIHLDNRIRFLRRNFHQPQVFSVW